MTNHWADIDNASCVLVWGANPVENHPAVAAHMNAARYGAKSAKLVVVDPRLTRTARQIRPDNGDFFVRIRPGSDIAFGNGVMKWIYAEIAKYQANSSDPTIYNKTAIQNLLAWHNGTATGSTAKRAFIADDGKTVQYPSYPKYCDSRFKVDTATLDYVRVSKSLSDEAATPANHTVSNFPDIAANVDDASTVFRMLEKHVAPYDSATVADICGCAEGDVAKVAKVMLDNSRFASGDFATSGNANGSTPQTAGYKATTILYAMGQTQHTCGSQNIKNFAIIQTFLGNMGRAGGGINALRGIHNVQGSTDFGLLYDSIHGYSGNPGIGEHYAHYVNTLFGNRVEGQGAVDYQDPSDPFYAANGRTAAFNDPSKLGLQQRGFHNTINEWFGKGSSSGADVAKLYELMPQGNGLQHITTFRKMSANEIKAAVVWGQNPCISEPNQTEVRKGLKNLDMLVCVDMFLTETAACDRKDGSTTYLIPACSYVEEAGSVTNSGRWLQWRERATKPMGDSKSDLELMLRFAKALDEAGAFGHIVAEWDALGTKIVPAVAGKAFTELYGKYGWDGASSFEAVPATLETWRPGEATPQNRAVVGSEVVAYNVHKEICQPLNASATSGGTMWIYSGNGNAAGYYSGALLDIQPQAKLGTPVSVVDESVTLTGTTASNLANVVAIAVQSVKSADGLTTYAASDYALATTAATSTIARTATSTIPSGASVLVTYTYDNTGKWLVKARAKSRNWSFQGASGNANALNYPRWGWAWLLNRRVFYNNGEVAMDVSDNFVNPGVVCNMFTTKSTALMDYSTTYRKFKNFADKPSVVQAADTTSPHYISTSPAVSLAGRFPGHTEPIESPRWSDLTPKWGYNMGGSGASQLIPADTLAARDDSSANANLKASTYPLVLTTIRCVEHFQGGPITRNNSYNVEAEPVPWVEINSLDASKYGIKDGDWVNIVTARSNTKTDQEALSPNATAGWNKGFKARVGVGLQSNQRVAQGVVAIPWHWGEKGLGTGARANDLCIDAFDANTMIPEYKACLCRIEPMNLV